MTGTPLSFAHTSSEIRELLRQFAHWLTSPAGAIPKEEKALLKQAQDLITEPAMHADIAALRKRQPDKLWHTCRTAKCAHDLAQKAGCDAEMQDDIYRLTFVATLHYVKGNSPSTLTREAPHDFTKRLNLLLETRRGSSPIYKLHFPELVSLAVLLRRDIRQEIRTRRARTRPHRRDSQVSFGPSLPCILDRLNRKRYSDPTTHADVIERATHLIRAMVQHELGNLSSVMKAKAGLPPPPQLG